jgi:hypothetical protein
MEGDCLQRKFQEFILHGIHGSFAHVQLFHDDLGGKIFKIYHGRESSASMLLFVRTPMWPFTLFQRSAHYLTREVKF